MRKLASGSFIAAALAVSITLISVAKASAGDAGQPKSTVISAEQTRSVKLELDVLPVLTSAGCNAGACHGKARGQNGFQLSLLGFDADFDYESLARQARGRRISLTAPESSLLLQKATALVPHGGGRRIEVGSPEYQTLLAWITSGLPRTTEADPKLLRIEVAPASRNMKPGEEQQLQVTAFYSDGASRNVTSVTAYQSSESPVVGVSNSGLVKAGTLPGEAAIMSRYMGLIAITNVVIPQQVKLSEELFAELPRYNFIDGLVWDKLRTLGIEPSGPADDAKFLRRAHLDVIGRLPTPEEARAFLKDTSPGKRERLIDALLDRPEYADFWANKWCDLLRPNPYRVGIKATFNLDGWLREAFRKNMPYDQFVREIVTAQGSTWQNGATTFFRDRRTPDEITTVVSQLFLGIRLECAKCHHHPFEVWAQSDFYSLAAYFARLGHKGQGVSPPISGGEEMIYTADKGSVKHPLTGEVLDPKPLFGDAPAIDPEGDPRDALAAWMTADNNPFFPRVMVNRVWNELMGRGIVDPVDDLRASNPPTNPALLDALAEEFRRQKYDQKKLLRAIMTSYVYGLSSLPSQHNASDTRNYSRHYRQRLRAEVLLDAVCDITGVQEDFDGLPSGTRAMEVWTNRIRSLFLDSFGRPDPNQDPPCERTPDSSVVQTLHLMNSPGLHRKVTNDKGRIAKLAESKQAPAEIIEELYLLAYARLPLPAERDALVGLYEKPGAERRQTTEDILWALINTPEFMFKD